MSRNYLIFNYIYLAKLQNAQQIASAEHMQIIFLNNIAGRMMNNIRGFVFDELWSQRLKRG